MAKTDVAVIGLRGIPASWGGVERQCEALYSRLAQSGLKIALYARTHYIPSGVSDYKGIRIISLPCLNTKHLEALTHTLLCILHLSLFVRPRIVHVYSQGPCLLLPLLRLLCPGAKVFFTCGGLDWRRRKWEGLGSRIIWLGEFFSAKLTHERVMVAKDLVEYYRKKYGVDSHYIPNGVDTPERLPPGPLLASLGLSAKGYFMFVGRLAPEKRVEDLAAAASLSRPGRLAVVGGGAGCESYEAGLYALAKDKTTLFTGYRYADELGELFSNALAYVTASELEGLPLTLLEAMSYGLPCLASSISPHREILGEDYAWYFPVANPGRLDELMRAVEALSPRELEAQGETLASLVARDFGWDQAATALAALYRKYLSPA